MSIMNLIRMSFRATAFLFAVVASAEEPTVIRGRVLLPDGKPAARAELYLVQSTPALAERPAELAFEKRAAADDQARFEFSLMEQEAPQENMTRFALRASPTKNDS